MNRIRIFQTKIFIKTFVLFIIPLVVFVEVFYDEKLFLGVYFMKQYLKTLKQPIIMPGFRDRWFRNVTIITKHGEFWFKFVCLLQLCPNAPNWCQCVTCVTIREGSNDTRAWNPAGSNSAAHQK